MNVAYNALVYFVWFMASYFSVFFFLSLIVNKDRIFEKKRYSSRFKPLVSFIIPAYNEEETIADTIDSLKKVNYDNVEFIFLSDGSSDRTPEIIRKNIAGTTNMFFVDRKKNLGKAATLNQGISLAKGEFIACMDADSIVEPDIVQKCLPYFREEDVGAVTVSVEVHKPKTFLHKIIALEFALGLSLFLKIYSFFDSVFVTPGPFSMYRASVLRKIGGFDVNNITEDHEIAYRIHKHHFKIKNAIEARVFTVLPPTFKKIYHQRKRWYSGSIQTFFQHKDMILNKNYGLFGFFNAFNYSLITIGLLLFGLSTFLGFKRLFTNLWYYKYTNFDFFNYFNFDWSLLYYGRVNILGFSLFLATLLLMVLGIYYSRRRFSENKLGLIGYPFLFFLYQIFWGGAILAVIRRKKISWR